MGPSNAVEAGDLGPNIRGLDEFRRLRAGVRARDGGGVWCACACASFSRTPPPSSAADFPRTASPTTRPPPRPSYRIALAQREVDTRDGAEGCGACVRGELPPLRDRVGRAHDHAALEAGLGVQLGCDLGGVQHVSVVPEVLRGQGGCGGGGRSEACCPRARARCTTALVTIGVGRRARACVGWAGPRPRRRGRQAPSSWASRPARHLRAPPPPLARPPAVCGRRSRGGVGSLVQQVRAGVRVRVRQAHGLCGHPAGQGCALGCPPRAAPKTQLMSSLATSGRKLRSRAMRSSAEASMATTRSMVGDVDRGHGGVCPPQKITRAAFEGSRGVDEFTQTRKLVWTDGEEPQATGRGAHAPLTSREAEGYGMVVMVGRCDDVTAANKKRGVRNVCATQIIGSSGDAG